MAIFETGARVQSAVNRINERIRTNVEHFGADSSIVQNMYSQIDLFLGQENLRLNNKGVLQIARPYSIYKEGDESKLEAIYQMDVGGVKTYGETKKEYQQAYERYKQEQEFFEEDFEFDIDEFIILNRNLPQAIAWLYPTDTEAKKAGLEIMQQRGRNKTYSELQRVVNLSNGVENV